ncbi:MAG TPA: glycosyltransferase family 4 protein [Tepidisphaeraceae bacterium]|nr:glycosyltransferase family 4 protein [Tepidisphaeraceae bacterium]
MRTLFITSFGPARGSGSGERSQSIVNALARFGDVELMLLKLPGMQMGPHDGDYFFEPFAGYGPWGWRRHHLTLQAFRPRRDLTEALDRITRDRHFDLFFCRFDVGIMTGCWRKGPSMIDLDGIPTDQRVTGNLPGLGAARRVAMDRVLRNYRTVFVTKAADVPKIHHPTIEVLPCVSTSVAPYDGDPPPGPPRVLFVGSMGVPWNRTALERFVAGSWPAIRARVPDAELRVVGGAQELVPRAEGVRPLGFVDDLEAEYRAATVVASVVRAGNGANVKMAEAARAGRPIVATTYSAGGYTGILEPGRDMLVAESDAEVADACVRVITDRALARGLAASVARTADAKLSQAAIDAIIARHVATLDRPAATPATAAAG